ncbi:YqgE/AlgH family protein [Myxococcota bacterium]|nr:YqgE/AlgH family protein [Myxococcota bacterium]MBU1899108.1 YqgE/AlgH family protein [Myxococcota bacterium]
MSDLILAPGVLIAMPQLRDPFFERSVVLMLEHSEEGALGLVINRPTDQPCQRVAQAFEVPWTGDIDARLLRGGPVEPQALWLLHEGGWSFDDTHRVIDGIGVSRSREAMARILEAEGALTLLIGCAGWGPGQLEEEIARGAWLIGEAKPEMLRWPLEARWSRALKLIGVDPARLVGGGATRQ